MKKRLHIYFSGRVQGVGFRFTARDLAGGLGILGWVKNLDDGRVEIMAEAEEEALGDFLGRLNKYFSRYVRDTEVERLPATGEFKDFGIAF